METINSKQKLIARERVAVSQLTHNFFKIKYVLRKLLGISLKFYLKAENRRKFRICCFTTTQLCAFALFALSIALFVIGIADLHRQGGNWTQLAIPFSKLPR